MEHVWGADKVEQAVSAEEALQKYNFDWENGIAQIIFFETGPIIARDYADDGKYQASRDLEVIKVGWNPSLMLPRLYKDREIADKQIVLPMT